MASETIPQWMNNSFFERVLRNSQGDKTLTISNICVVKSENSGEHNASTIYKATVKFSSKFNNDALIKLVVKIVNSLSDSNSFDTELNMYLNTIPDMQRLLSQNGEKIELAPRLLYSAKEPVSVLVLEDVTMNGYGLSLEPLNYEETLFVTSKIAKWHAASMFMDRDTNSVHYYENGLFNIGPKDGLDFMMNNMKLFIDEIKEWAGYELITEKLEKLLPRFNELGVKAFKMNTGNDGYNVLNHGDLSFKNMVFKKDNEGKMTDVLFLDFQLTKWASPSIDLMYLLYMVASTETQDNYRDQVILHYYNEFVSSLKSIGFMNKPPPMLDLNVELLKNGFLEVLIAVCFLPFFYIDQTQDANAAFENGVDGVNLRKSLYQNPQYKEMITKLMPDFLYKGSMN
ncbi:unnamed protein product [Diamesa hyperborea]